MHAAERGTEVALLCGPRNHPPVANFVSDGTTRLFALVLERRDLAGMFPKLNVMAIHKRFCPLYSLFVAITIDGDRFEKLAVSPDDVSAVICHVMHPCVWAGAQHSLSPMVAHGGAVIAISVISNTRRSVQYCSPREIVNRRKLGLLADIDSLDSITDAFSPLGT